MNDISTADQKIALIGLGYVGLPLAHLFSTRYRVTGFDSKKERVDTLNRYIDQTLSLSEEELKEAMTKDAAATCGLVITSDPSELKNCNVYIIAVPTPIDQSNKPDLDPLKNASALVAKYLNINDIVIFESTVYPGVTEEVCAPILEEESGLVFNKDFFLGYSPERINPGDKVHTVEKIVKITSGSTPEVAKLVDSLYSSVVEAGTYLAPSIRIAEAAKVIENTQRDVNIAFVNELAKIFNILGIDTNEVLKAAGTKWNFLPFKPGLVGGHCLGVDPYYLADKAIQSGYHPEIILAGRRINDSMGNYVASETINLLAAQHKPFKETAILILGITFKENCTDIRNSKVMDIYNSFLKLGIQVSVYDPWASPSEVKEELGIQLLDNLDAHTFDAIVLAVAHREFFNLDVRSKLNKNGVIYDVKHVLNHKVDGGL